MFSSLWCLHDFEPRSGPLNMALDETILDFAAETARPVLRIYCWAEPFVSIGYFDSIEIAERQFPRRPLVRRWTGGGAVDHASDFTFTLAVPVTEMLSRWPAARRYAEIHAAVAAALAQLGVATECVGRTRAVPPGSSPEPCFAAPVPGDLVSRDGAKMVGGAQRRTRAGVLHQGSIQAPASGLDLKSLAPALAAAFGHERHTLSLNADWLERARTLADAKYATIDWLRAR